MRFVAAQVVAALFLVGDCGILDKNAAPKLPTAAGSVASLKASLLSRPFKNDADIGLALSGVAALDNANTGKFAAFFSAGAMTCHTLRT